MARKRDTNQKGEFQAIVSQIVDKTLSATKDIRDIDIEYISTGILLFDMLLGGGILKNRIFMLGAGTSVGKTTLCIQTAKNFIEQNIQAGKEHLTTVIYIDAENSLTYSRFIQLGIKPEWLGLKVETDNKTSQRKLVKDPNIRPIITVRSGKVNWFDIERLFDELYVITSRLNESEKPEILVIIDSLPAIDTPDMEEKSLSESEQPGQLGKLVGRLTDKLVKILPNANATVIFVNHVRPVIQAMPMQPLNVGAIVKSGMRMPGGTKIQYYASQIVVLKQKGQKDIGGLTLKFIEATTWKNRAFASDKSVTLVYEDTYGFSEALTNFLYLREIKVLVPAGGKWKVTDTEFAEKYPELQKARTVREIVKDYATNPEFRRAFYELTRHHAFERLVKPYIIETELPELTEVLVNQADLSDVSLDTIADEEDMIKQEGEAQNNTVDFEL